MKKVLIIGASSGIGLAIAKMLKNKGFEVYGTSRKVQTVEGIQMIKLDVQDSGQVDSVINSFDRLDVLINCAGMGIAGPLEDMSEQQVSEITDINYMGAIRTIKAVLPIMRNQGGGDIINIGSVASTYPIPYHSMYSSLKSALVSLTLALRLEVKKFNINVCMIEPGDTKTGFTAARKFAYGIRKNDAYKADCESAVNTMIRDEINGYDPDTVAKEVLKAIRKRPIRKQVCVKYKVLVAIKRLAPYKLAEFIVSCLYLNNKDKRYFKYE